MNELLSSMGRCKIYDGAQEKLLTWYCGEGIGSAPPIDSFDFNTGENSELFLGNEISKARFDLDHFILLDIYRNEVEQTLSTFDPLSGETVTYNFAEDLYYNNSIYDVIQLKEESTFVVGGANTVSFLRYDEENIIQEIEEVDLGEYVYVNSIYSSEDKLYIPATFESDKILIIDLNTMTVSKGYDLNTPESEYTEVRAYYK